MADVRRAVREWAGDLDTSPGHYLVALSGGGDSLALAWALSKEAPALHLPLGAVIVDHQLQEGSSEIAQRAAETVAQWGLSPAIIKRVSVGDQGGPEEAARAARYGAFREAMRETGARGVILAHTKDDQAETVVLGMGRGSGPSALKGMAAREGTYHRPLLRLSRKTLRTALVDAGIEWWDDPHNENERYARVRVRNRVLPVWEEELGPGISDALSRTASLFRQDSDALDSFAQVFVAEHVEASNPSERSVSVQALMEQPAAVHTRALRMMVIAVGGSAPSFAQMDQILTVLRNWRGQSALDLSGVTLERTEGRIMVRSKKNSPSKGLPDGF
jgi:tRNA(Ile)-lysidine synthase